MKKARIRYDKQDMHWVLELLIDGEWSFSVAWFCKDEDPETKQAWVCDDVLCQIAHLQRTGWSVEVRV